MVLSINILKYYLTLLTELYLKQNDIKSKKKNNILEKNKDVGDLIKYLEQKNILNPIEIDYYNNHWDVRNKTVHNYINGKISYEDVGIQAKHSFKMCKIIFKKAFVITVGPEEKVKGQFRRKITISPKKI